MTMPGGAEQESDEVMTVVPSCRFRSVTNLTRCEELDARALGCEGCTELVME